MRGRIGKTVSVPVSVRGKRGISDISKNETMDGPSGHRFNCCFELTAERLLGKKPWAFCGLHVEYKRFVAEYMSDRISEDITWDSTFGVKATFRPQTIFGPREGIRDEISHVIRQELYNESLSDCRTMLFIQYNGADDYFGDNPEGHIIALYPEFWDSRNGFLDKAGNEEKIVTDFGDEKSNKREKIQELANDICNYIIVLASEKDLNPVACQIIYITEQSNQPKLLKSALN